MGVRRKPGITGLPSAKRAAFVSRLVEERNECAGIARDEDRACSVRGRGTSGHWIECRHSFGIKRERGVVKSNALHVGCATSHCQDIIEIFDLLISIRPRAPDGDAVAVKLHVGNMRVGFQHKLLVEGHNGVCTDFRIAERPNAAPHCH
jgi:hypothetical protein